MEVPAGLIKEIIDHLNMDIQESKIGIERDEYLIKKLEGLAFRKVERVI
jgi:hypothetical protein